MYTIVAANTETWETYVEHYTSINSSKAEAVGEFLRDTKESSAKIVIVAIFSCSCDSIMKGNYALNGTEILDGIVEV
jgi:hypothetical protein